MSVEHPHKVDLYKEMLEFRNEYMGNRYVRTKKSLEHITSYNGPSPDHGRQAAQLRAEIALLDTLSDHLYRILEDYRKKMIPDYQI